ncbi:MAG: hypothetical protein ACXAC5_00270 [Promethearchaeota archaeon]|jgi:hypothetical protein
MATPIPTPVPRPREPIIPVDPVPRFPAAVQGVWRFNNSLEDLVGSEDFVPSTGSPVYTQFSKFELIPNRTETRSGLQFEEGKTYAVSPAYDFPDNITLSFWYFSPGLVGFTRHFVTRELEAKVAPIIAKANSTTTSTSTSLNTSSFVITEIGYSKTQNAVRAFITSNGTDVSHVVTSEPYNPGLHHVFISFSRTRGRWRIDIDGKTGIQHSAPITSISRAGEFSINKIVPGYLAHKTTQVGAYIFDLVFSVISSRDNESLKAMRYGYEHISFDNLFDTRFSYFGMSYAQPTTISTTHIFVDGGNIFAARSNGKIVKGARPVWDKEFNYENLQVVSLLNISQVDTLAEGEQPTKANRFVQWTTNGLRLRGASVTI